MSPCILSFHKFWKIRVIQIVQLQVDCMNLISGGIILDLKRKIGLGYWWTTQGEIDPDKTIAEQFDLMRVCDPDRYPAYFNYLGYKYVIRIEKQTV